jgi:hypothetical protein
MPVRPPSLDAAKDIPCTRQETLAAQPKREGTITCAILDINLCKVVQPVALTSAFATFGGLLLGRAFSGQGRAAFARGPDGFMIHTLPAEEPSCVPCRVTRSV